MISGLVERKFIMHNNLPFKPLLITVALASLFPMGVANASTYGIHANSQDLIIEDQNTFENVDYGVAAENGHTARERQKFCVHGIIGARQTGASNEHEHQTQFS